jgi:hypothetical protein
MIYRAANMNNDHQTISGTFFEVPMYLCCAFILKYWETHDGLGRVQGLSRRS